MLIQHNLSISQNQLKRTAKQSCTWMKWHVASRTWCSFAKEKSAIIILWRLSFLSQCIYTRLIPLLPVRINGVLFLAQISANTAQGISVVLSPNIVITYKLQYICTDSLGAKSHESIVASAEIQRLCLVLCAKCAMFMAVEEEGTPTPLGTELCARRMQAGCKKHCRAALQLFMVERYWWCCGMLQSSFGTVVLSSVSVVSTGFLVLCLWSS